MNGDNPAGRLTSWALLLCALAIGGCAGIRVDPTGEAVFTTKAPTVPIYDPFARPTQVILTPQTVIAPIGTQVAVIASVRGPDDYLRTNQRVDWSLEPGSVGQFLNLNRRTFMDLVVLDPVTPEIRGPGNAVGSTTREYQRLPRGPGASGALDIVPGQAWIVVGSCAEGTSQVAASSPCIPACGKSLATIHWVDVQWNLPPPSIHPAGTRYTLTTSVMRQSNHAPLAGYIIHYEIADGPPAGFQPGGTRATDVATDTAGQACAEIVEPQPIPGTNRIAIQIIRPAGFAGSSPQLVVGRGMTLKTWTSPGIAVHRTGPTAAAVGAPLTFRIEVSNPGDQPAENVVLTEAIPDGLTLLASRPAGEPAGKTVRWNLGRLGALENRTLEIDYRADRAGSFTTCAIASAAAGLTSRDCTTTSVGLSLPSPQPGAPTLPPRLPPNFPRPPAEGPAAEPTNPSANPSSPTAGTATPTIDLQLTGPSQVTVGDQVNFEAVVTNLGQVPAVGLRLRDQFDPGLDHPGVTRHAIDKDLSELAPNQSLRVRIPFTVSGTGELCHTVDVRYGKLVLATRKQCVTSIASPTTAPPSPGAVGPTTPAWPPGLTTPTPGTPVPGTPAPGTPVPGMPVPGTSGAPATGMGTPGTGTPDAGATGTGTPGTAVPGAPLTPPPIGPPGLTLKLKSPPSATVGDVVQFFMQVTNSTSTALNEVKVTSLLDANFLATDATKGCKIEGENYTWTIPSLQPNEPTTFVIKANCVSPGLSACNRVRVACREGLQADDHACLEVRAAAQSDSGNLDVSISGVPEPVNVAQEETYYVDVVNRGQQPDSQVALVVELPSQMVPVPLQTVGPDVDGHRLSYDIRGQTVTFQPAGRLDPGQKLSYRIHARTIAAGEVQVQAQVTSQSVRQAKTAQRKTTINVPNPSP